MSEKRLYFYYAILMIVMMSWQNSYAPNMILRIAYLVAVVTPAILFNRAFLPAVITCFWTVSMYGYSYSYMPTMHYLYAILVILLFIFRGRVNRVRLPNFRYLWFFLFFSAFIDILTNIKLSNMSYSFFVMLVLPYLVSGNSEKEEKIIDYMEIGFIIISLVLSYYSLTTRDMFTKTGADYERISWMDQNYLGMTIGMGAVIAFRKLLHSNNYNTLSTVLFAITFALSSVAMLFLGSRGAILCLVVCISFFLFRSKTKTVTKVLIFLMFLVFINYLYTHDYFYILQTRIQEDDGTGSNRTFIWTEKLRIFLEQNPVKWVFGMGNQKALEITCFPGDRITAFHNDFIATFVSYGLIGFGLLVYMFYLPFKIAKENSQALPEVIALILYLGLSFMTLEPFTQADFVFMAFYLYILFVAKYGMHDSVVK